MDPDLETDTTAVELITCTGDGWPALAHIGVGELLLGSDGLLRTVLGRESRTCAALTEAGRGALVFTGADQLLEVRCLVLAQARLDTSKALTGFLLAPVASRDKRAPYATIRSGVAFELHDARGVHAQWKRARAALAALFPTRETKETLS